MNRREFLASSFTSLAAFGLAEKIQAQPCVLEKTQKKTYKREKLNRREKNAWIRWYYGQDPRFHAGIEELVSHFYGINFLRDCAKELILIGDAFVFDSEPAAPYSVPAFIDSDWIEIINGKTFILPGNELKKYALKKGNIIPRKIQELVQAGKPIPFDGIRLTSGILSHWDGGTWRLASEETTYSVIHVINNCRCELLRIFSEVELNNNVGTDNQIYALSKLIEIKNI